MNPVNEQSKKCDSHLHARHRGHEIHRSIQTQGGIAISDTIDFASSECMGFGVVFQNHGGDFTMERKGHIIGIKFVLRVLDN